MSQIFATIPPYDHKFTSTNLQKYSRPEDIFLTVMNILLDLKHIAIISFIPSLHVFFSDPFVIFERFLI